MERVSASVLFADLTGFTDVVDGYDDEAYLSFMTEFRSVVFRCITPLFSGNRIAYGFWGDEVKVIFYGLDVSLNARHALTCACDLQTGWIASAVNRARHSCNLEPLRLKIGIATAEVAVGLFPGASTPEIEGRPLCTARTLSKQAKYGMAGCIFLDRTTYDLVAHHPTSPSFKRVEEPAAFEVCLPSLEGNHT
jgi:class 3 adenylate cyclase